MTDHTDPTRRPNPDEWSWPFCKGCGSLRFGHHYPDCRLRPGGKRKENRRDR